ncbi:hypothetical protein ACWGE1_21170 [Streptomyces sp. NPDC054932]
MDRDALGAQGGKVYRQYTNAPESNATGRNVTLLPSKFVTASGPGAIPSLPRRFRLPASE